jgi:hypothetical protein
MTDTEKKGKHPDAGRKKGVFGSSDQVAPVYRYDDFDKDGNIIPKGPPEKAPNPDNRGETIIDINPDGSQVITDTQHFDPDNIQDRAVMTGFNGPTAVRTELETEMDLVEEARLYLRGYSLNEVTKYIADNRPYSLSVQMIARDMTVIRDRWRAQYLANFDDVKAQELARLDRLELAYWTEYDKSKQDKDTIETVKVNDEWEASKNKENPDKTKASGYSRTRVKHTREKMLGNPVYLQGVHWCITQRCKILGLDSPKILNINWRSSAEAAGINPDKLQNELVNQFMLAAGVGNTNEK